MKEVGLVNVKPSRLVIVSLKVNQGKHGMRQSKKVLKVKKISKVLAKGRNACKLFIKNCPIQVNMENRN